MVEIIFSKPGEVILVIIFLIVTLLVLYILIDNKAMGQIISMIFFWMPGGKDIINTDMLPV